MAACRSDVYKTADGITVYCDFLCSGLCDGTDGREDDGSIFSYDRESDDPYVMVGRMFHNRVWNRGLFGCEFFSFAGYFGKCEKYWKWYERFISNQKSEKWYFV